MTAQFAVFDADLNAHVAAQEDAKSKTEAEADFAGPGRRRDLPPRCAGISQASTSASPAARQEAGLPPRQRHPHAGRRAGQPPRDRRRRRRGRAARPADERQHNEQARPRPADAAKVILYRKVVAAGGPAPAGLAEMDQVNAYTTSKVVLMYDGSQNGSTVYYGACYANVKNEAGPTSTIVAATIAA